MVALPSKQLVCHSCKLRTEGTMSRVAARQEERRLEVRNRYPYLTIPIRLPPIDRVMFEQGSESVIRKYKRLWSRRTETGSMDVLLIDAANRVFRYIHIQSLGAIDYEEDVEPMIQIVPTMAPEEIGNRITSPAEAADLIRLRRIDRLVNNDGI